MASASHHTRAPFPRSSSYPVPRSKTPHPAFERFHSDEQLKRTRTPQPHEEDIRYRRRTTSTSAWVPGQQRHRTADTRLRERPETPDPIARRTEYDDDDSFNPPFNPSEQYLWDRRAYNIDTRIHLWMQEDEARRMAAARETAQTRLIQEEVRRMHEKICLKHNIERQQQVLEERRLANERVWSRRQRAAAEKVISGAWEIYERNWAIILSTSDLLSFSSIPWPTLSRPLKPSSITPAAISAFLLSESHSVSRKPKDRIKEALRRWHPDRFGRLMQRVPLEEKDTIEEAVDVVTSCLNELMGLYSG